MVLARNLVVVVFFGNFEAGAQFLYYRNFFINNAEVYVKFLNLNADVLVFLDEDRLLHELQGAEPTLGVSEPEGVAFLIKINYRVVFAYTQILDSHFRSLVSTYLNLFALCDFDNLNVFSRTQAKNLHNYKVLRNGTSEIIDVLHLCPDLNLVRINSHAKLASICFPDVISCDC